MPLTLEEQREQEAFEALVSKFPKRYQVKTSEYLQALIRALATGDGYVETQIESTRDNSLVVTAVGKHLDILGSQYGVVRGQGVGVQDDDYRKLIPLLGYSPKQIASIMNQVVDSIYGPYSSHANTTSSLAEPYNLFHGSKLFVKVDNDSLEITFKNSDFSSIVNASAEEVATAISANTNGRLIGSVVSNARTGQKYVNIRTSTVGSQGFVQVVGGDSQAKFKFPEVRQTLQNIATWDVGIVGGGGELEFTVSSGIGPSPKISGVQQGDFVHLRTDSGFDDRNVGYFEITKVGTNSFRCKNPNGVSETGITQSNVDDFTFYKADIGNVLLSSSPAVVLQTNAKEITVMLPVTSPLVKRTLKGGHHFHGGVSTIDSVTSNSMTLTGSSEFPNAGAVRIISDRAKSRGTISSITSNTITLVSAEGWPTSGAVWNNVNQTYYYYASKTGNTLNGVTPTPTSTIVGAIAKYSKRFSYTSKSGDTLNGVYPSSLGLVGLDVGVAESQIIDGFPGSFLYDAQATYIGSNLKANLDKKINQGSNLTLIQLKNVDLSQWPNSGYIAFEPRTSEEEAPVRYLSKVGSNALVIDPGHLFQKDHLVGSVVRLIRQVGPYQPRTDGSDYAVYHTSTSPARDLIIQYLRDIAASGITMRFIINIPDYKWNVLPLLYASNPLDTSLA